MPRWPSDWLGLSPEASHTARVAGSHRTNGFVFSNTVELGNLNAPNFVYGAVGSPRFVRARISGQNNMRRPAGASQPIEISLRSISDDLGIAQSNSSDYRFFYRPERMPWVTW
ncbi:hypothetical protein BRM21_13145 [Xanthomonas oryzae pv. oryzae]|nr:hypothetical protein BRN52_00345 [Xanthomonas oryzae pv. oryzae]QBA09532.1 hypothetical protein DZA53_00355 [Xanthomonas oryzae pv. oryzae]QBN89226.1 hypothetical protein EBA18_00345 [Xanthomonas oryzae pv. oryzae]QBO00859.1 hypothetical protein EBA21_00340 [Xanthomonas oryzae pv. oryzae]QEJ69668.1 hypothetical protein BXO1_017815 [Xanthomonas oryzae pv. oryzae]